MSHCPQCADYQRQLNAVEGDRDEWKAKYEQTHRKYDEFRDKIEVILERIETKLSAISEAPE